MHGDLNDVQQLALVSSIGQRESKEFDRDWRQFVMTAVAMHPENTESIMKMLDKDSMEEEAASYAKELTDEEMQEYVPIQLRPEKQDIIRDLQSLGVAIIDG